MTGRLPVGVVDVHDSAGFAEDALFGRRGRKTVSSSPPPELSAGPPNGFTVSAIKKKNYKKYKVYKDECSLLIVDEGNCACVLF